MHISRKCYTFATEIENRKSRAERKHKLGVPAEGVSESVSHDVEGIVSVELDATHNFSQPLTEQRLLTWHTELFPTERRRLYRIDVGQYRTHAMQVVSGNMGRECIHYEAPEPARVQHEMAQFLRWLNEQDDGIPFENIHLDTDNKQTLICM